MQRHISVNLGNLLLSLSEITDLANTEISYHQQRTAFIAVEIATFAGEDESVIEDIFAASLLHDVGAISIEEKTKLHSITNIHDDTINKEFHCKRGEMLLNKTPWFKGISKIVRYHHTDYMDFEDTIKDTFVFSSQVIYLADYVERLVDRSKYILHQHKEIIDKIKELDDTFVHPDIVNYFLQASEREEFWLDLVSPRLYSVLLDNGPYRNLDIDINNIIHISEMYKSVIDFKSPYTATHTTGVAACAQSISIKFGLTDFETNLMKIAGHLHDIGKLVIPNSIIEKPGKLTQHEFALMKSHTYYTHHVINTIGGLERIADWAAYHHEKLDGSGYPFRCKQHEIGIGARIMTVADIFTAITEDRPYRKGMNKDEVYSVLKQNISDDKLDKNIVNLLLDNYYNISHDVKAKQNEARHFYEDIFLG
ncbi:HD domain-containing protein [Alkalibaculum sp. M08DMB]|uniref:HD domain-containing protein n=1 Tax=Alkalibaculum sporogenes TaxID=2655001 RepID=A0A6A7KCN8_9FIRM|nr:HD domain-containing phosphohydrolase [Alkalibaculum sporogenes]MPW27115.1 HD domain-containing protein [Alkalibaculum sporogenes]